MVKRRKTLEAGGVSKVLQSLLQPLGAVLISLVLGAIIIAVSGEDVLNAYGIMSVSSPAVSSAARSSAPRLTRSAASRT